MDGCARLCGHRQSMTTKKPRHDWQPTGRLVCAAIETSACWNTEENLALRILQRKRISSQQHQIGSRSTILVLLAWISIMSLLAQ
jgi:hypothetical protein